MNKALVALVIAALTVIAIMVAGIYWMAVKVLLWAVRQAFGGLR